MLEEVEGFLIKVEAVVEDVIIMKGKAIAIIIIIIGKNFRVKIINNLKIMTNLVLLLP